VKSIILFSPALLCSIFLQISNVFGQIETDCVYDNKMFTNEFITSNINIEKYTWDNENKATVTRDLQDLVEKKALVRKGELKYTRYELNMEGL
jgi:hypothetical protein